MFEKILLPLDGSTLAEFARPPAAEIARRAGAAVEVVVVHDTVPAFALGEWESKPRISKEEYLGFVEDDLRTYTGGPVSHLVCPSQAES